MCIRDRTKRERELKAADRIFGLLPDAQRMEYRGLWDEFEAMETAEAKFANMLDKVQPLLLNNASDGKSWVEHGVRKSPVSYTHLDVYKRQGLHKAGSVCSGGRDVHRGSSHLPAVFSF